MEPSRAQPLEATVLILAGPNGAGKTTASRIIVPAGTTFVNADTIARQLAEGGHPPEGLDIAAGRIVLKLIRELAGRGASFCVETNLAGRGFVRSIGVWRGQGYRVEIAFVGLVSPELAILRVARRVELGGHAVPEPVIRRRWRQGLVAFFQTYSDLADGWTLADNSRDAPIQVARRQRGSVDTEVLDSALWSHYNELSRG